MLRCALAFVLLAAAGCSGVGDKVMQDFGLQERPEDYVSGRERAMAELDRVGRTETARLSNAVRTGEVKYEEENESVGYYYRERKIYESYKPIDAYPTSARRGAGSTRGFVGTIEYVYEYFESARVNSRADAERAPTTIATGRRGVEVLRYDLDASGRWNGGEGRGGS